MTNDRLVSDLIKELPFDATILYASVNNEGWSRGGWAKEIVHKAEPVPNDAAEVRTWPGEGRGD